MSEILLITGPPGAGKSTACEAFAKTGDGMWAFIEQDAIRQLVKAGFKNPSDPWTKATETQMNVSISICGDMIKRYQESGINCIVDCFITLDPYVFDKWQAALKDVTYKIIVLLPEAHEAVRRNNQRTGDNRLNETQVHDQRELMAAWRDDSRAVIIDSTAMNVPEVVQTMRAALNSQ